MKYRSKIEIVAAVLAVAREKVKKTHIMYRGNLSYKLLNGYLAVVMKSGLISLNPEDDSYLLTDKGKMFLERFNKYSRRVKGMEKQLSQIKGEMVSLEEMCSASDLPNNECMPGENGHSEENGKSPRSIRFLEQNEGRGTLG